MKHKICPLFLAARLSNCKTKEGDDADTSAVECLGENCAWYDPDDLPGCAIQVVANSLDTIAGQM